MHLVGSFPSPMLCRHSSSPSPFLSKALSFLTHCPLHPHLHRHPHPDHHAVSGARVLHSASIFLSLKDDNTTRKRPTKSFQHHLHQRHMNSGATSAQSTVPMAPPSEKRKGDAIEGGHPSRKAMNKARRESPEGVLRHKLDMCSKRGNLLEALRLYDEARSQSIPLTQHHYNVLLYLCASPSPSSPDSAEETNPSRPSTETAKLGVERGFEIFRQMRLDSIPPNEATFTSLARLAAAKEDPELAFQLVKQMSSAGILPRLRSYGPALFGFCKNGDAEKAYVVESHMAQSGVLPEEAELAALLQLSAVAGRGDHVYRLLHRMRSTVRQVSASTAEIVEGWFGSDGAGRVGVEEWDVGKVKEGVVNGGGGWHGQGWLRTGKWSVGRTGVDETGVCRRCGEKLVSIDIDPIETENFANSLASLACQREVKTDFNSFQEWLGHHGPFDAVIDGANVGLYNQRNLSFFHINSVVNGIQQMTPSKKLPLIVLHSRHVKGGPADNPSNRKLIENWRRSGALYTTPPGSNDDWYWLYAAVNCRCLLVTNDEMRDHLFELLGTSFFPRWKEKHQFQEAEGGSWHVPTVTGDDIETPREWVCATRDPVSFHCHAA